MKTTKSEFEQILRNERLSLSAVYYCFRAMSAFCAGVVPGYRALFPNNGMPNGSAMPCEEYVDGVIDAIFDQKVPPFFECHAQMVEAMGLVISLYGGSISDWLADTGHNAVQFDSNRALEDFSWELRRLENPHNVLRHNIARFPELTLPGQDDEFQKCVLSINNDSLWLYYSVANIAIEVFDRHVRPFAESADPAIGNYALDMWIDGEDVAAKLDKIGRAADSKDDGEPLDQDFIDCVLWEMRREEVPPEIIARVKQELAKVAAKNQKQDT